MTAITKTAGIPLLLSALALPLAAPVAAQDNDDINVYGSALVDGPQVEGIITAKSGDKIQVTMENGQNTTIIIDDGTEVKATGGFLGLGSKSLRTDQLMNGLPVEVDTLQFDGGLVASKVKLKASQVVGLKESAKPEPPGLGIKKCIAMRKTTAKETKKGLLSGSCVT